MQRSSRSIPTGPGSRGGTYHLDPAAYARQWRAAHPEYRERERLRRARQRTGDPALTVPRKAARLTPAEFCVCGCGCRAPVVRVCGFCAEGLHGDE